MHPGLLRVMRVSVVTALFPSGLIELTLLFNSQHKCVSVNKGLVFCFLGFFLVCFFFIHTIRSFMVWIS